MGRKRLLTDVWLWPMCAICGGQKTAKCGPSIKGAFVRKAPFKKAEINFDSLEFLSA